MTTTRRLLITGQVQGVGFRPFVFRLAQQFGLNGTVKNLTGQVEVFVQGSEQTISQFTDALLNKAPPLARPELSESTILQIPAFSDFRILPSEHLQQADIHVPPDFFMCDDCLQEVSDPAQRRYRYPFINCTQCGPRYTLIQQMPYDRQHTSMHCFPLCADCQSEFSNPIDRRFHAQPLACPECGPSLTFVQDSQTIDDNSACLAAAVRALKSGQIVAVKGIGGYHLLCDALNIDAVNRLRQRKNRPHKPLAVMFPLQGVAGAESLLGHTDTDSSALEQLLSPQRPIVLVRKKPGSALAENIAPGIAEIGAFFPYSPLHHLLLDDFAEPLVATSGNISGEPVLTDEKEACQRLAGIADCFLQHNRPIERPADDSVLRMIANKAMTIRGGRGLSPIEITLPCRLAKPTLAVGGHLKATIALAWENRLVLSPHIADLGTRRSMSIFEQVIGDLQRLYQVRAERIICDSHPGYLSTRWAHQQSLPVTSVLHHHAHATVVAGQYPTVKNWLTFCWDGVGLGADGSLWGGETFFGNAARWQHIASMQPFYLPGADRAGREPWRSSAALLWQIGEDYLPAIDNAELALAAWQKKLNCPQSSAVGRLFDAAACMALGIEQCSFEGQAAMMLEAAITPTRHSAPRLPVSHDSGGLLRIDWQPLIDMLQNDEIPVGERAALFHDALANSVINLALDLQTTHNFEAVGLSGGVFQNRYLVEKIMALAAQENLPVYTSHTIPVNDGGLAYGQVIEMLFQDNAR